VSTSFGDEGRSSEAREDSEVEDEEGRGLSAGEMSAEEVGVESVVASRRRASSCRKAVVDIAEKMNCLRYDVCRQWSSCTTEDAGIERVLQEERVIEYDCLAWCARR
jgi:hypothetical protein